MKNRQTRKAVVAQGPTFEGKPKSGGKGVRLILSASLNGKTQTQIIDDPKGELFLNDADEEKMEVSKTRLVRLIKGNAKAQEELASLREQLDSERIATRKLHEIVENRLCSRGVGPATRCMCCDAVRDVIETPDDDFRTLEEQQDQEQVAPKDEPIKNFQFPYMQTIQVHQTALNRSEE
jgi:hypothetical protein